MLHSSQIEGVQLANRRVASGSARKQRLRHRGALPFRSQEARLQLSQDQRRPDLFDASWDYADQKISLQMDGQMVCRTTAGHRRAGDCRDQDVGSAVHRSVSDHARFSAPCRAQEHQQDREVRNRAILASRICVPRNDPGILHGGLSSRQEIRRNRRFHAGHRSVPRLRQPDRIARLLHDHALDYSDRIHTGHAHGRVPDGHVDGRRRVCCMEHPIVSAVALPPWNYAIEAARSRIRNVHEDHERLWTSQSG
mmetsp:Transcript_16631/g.46570  ORF Transcript_16631/g.46570 Transcript_16631/m.46570 type:complete len:252 (-) Transcript_16631:885-1640(-)